MEQQEIWKDIEGYEGFYQVSNLGRVRSLDRIQTIATNQGRTYTRSYPGKILSQSYASFEGQQTSYKFVSLSIHQVSQTFFVHRLVAQAFISNPDNLLQVNHKDENAANNSVSNLEWCTPSYNVNYGTRNKRVRDSLKGRKKPPEAVAKMRKSLKGNVPWNKGLRTRPITCLDANLEFKSSDEAAKWIGGVTSAAVEYAAKHIACCKGHVFVYSDNIPKDTESYVKQCIESYQRGSKAGRPLKCIEDNKVFKFITDAANYYNINRNSFDYKLRSGNGTKLLDGRIVHFKRITFEEFENSI